MLESLKNANLGALETTLYNLYAVHRGHWRISLSTPGDVQYNGEISMSTPGEGVFSTKFLPQGI